MAIVIDRRLQTCSDDELQRIAERLFRVWAEKGYLPRHLMPVAWEAEVQKLRVEMARRGVQLRLF